MAMSTNSTGHLCLLRALLDMGGFSRVVSRVKENRIVVDNFILSSVGGRFEFLCLPQGLSFISFFLLFLGFLFGLYVCLITVCIVRKSVTPGKLPLMSESLHSASFIITWPTLSAPLPQVANEMSRNTTPVTSKGVPLCLTSPFTFIMRSVSMTTCAFSRYLPMHFELKAKITF